MERRKRRKEDNTAQPVFPLPKTGHGTLKEALLTQLAPPLLSPMLATAQPATISWPSKKHTLWREITWKIRLTGVLLFLLISLRGRTLAIPAPSDLSGLTGHWTIAPPNTAPKCETPVQEAPMAPGTGDLWPPLPFLFMCPDLMIGTPTVLESHRLEVEVIKCAWSIHMLKSSNALLQGQPLPRRLRVLGFAWSTLPTLSQCQTTFA
ncbi:hypothetical protein P691DRAFT_789880 [Macrolepiota fuliginosa MF-IS2]|uniref:Uncharacterized protein n=1 Tax=Macrolepiota fuliginosa MF-IS2 TaxID=1400762 RepID=A0A9P5X0W7_9AGAR|nr:hypothetical protein P691DRAFT_789880 [Macrolepiota fuliginosa MF-IS2]